MKLELDIKLDGSNFDIWLSDDCGSGISIKGNNHKEVTDKLNSYLEHYLNDIYFQVNGVDVLSRSDYESLSSPMCAKEVSNETMQEIANDIFSILVNKYGENDVIKYFTNELEDEYVWDCIDSLFWKEMQSIGLSKGITYKTNNV